MPMVVRIATVAHNTSSTVTKRSNLLRARNVGLMRARPNRPASRPSTGADQRRRSSCPRVSVDA